MRAFLLLLMMLGVASADQYPSRTVRLVVPASAGNGLDVLARSFAPAFSTALGGPVIVENRPGSGQLIGTLQVTKALPDGHTLLFGTRTLTISQAVLRDPPYSIYELAPIRGVASSPFILATG